ncbi:hypothetical protein [Oryza sativa Japonica Group]|uniref:Uncharacterized protein n=1 Tax=Oryza sativa subsp. japonica TaxID=39947 RepID=Q5Z8R0_ORYSJ|nr:hypothetical protein [Oryza sativa Japonica Group]BAD53854.1 hypothetical protein [Oryza sativa Japonica Group]
MAAAGNHRVACVAASQSGQLAVGRCALAIRSTPWQIGVVHVRAAWLPRQCHVYATWYTRPSHVDLVHHGPNRLVSLTDAPMAIKDRFAGNPGRIIVVTTSQRGQWLDL